MTTTTATALPRRRPGRRGSRAGRYLLIAPYALLLLVFGVLPTGYAIYISLTAIAQVGAHSRGIANYLYAVHDYRFLSAFAHVALFLLIYLPVMAVLNVSLALMLQARRGRFASAVKFIYYLPGAVSGAASVLLWLFMLDPSVSPARSLLAGLGYRTLAQSVEPAHLPAVFAVILFATGAGTWIVTFYGALNAIPDDLVEAARIDGASAWQLALRVKIPLIRKWIAYMIILCFAGGSQLFVEPELVNTATQGLVGPAWSPSQLSYVYAFQNNNFGGAAAVSVFLLIISLAAALVVVFRTRLFSAG